MKIELLIAKRLADFGLHKPGPGLVRELEKEIMPKVESLVVSTVTPRLAARAFAATLAAHAAAGKGVLRGGR